jgi:hypothetical protein
MYSTTPGPWQTQFFGENGGVGERDLPGFLTGLGAAVLFAIVSARVGLLWGNWMRRVRR